MTVAERDLYPLILYEASIRDQSPTDVERGINERNDEIVHL